MNICALGPEFLELGSSSWRGKFGCSSVSNKSPHGTFAKAFCYCESVSDSEKTTEFSLEPGFLSGSEFPGTGKAGGWRSLPPPCFPGFEKVLDSPLVAEVGISGEVALEFFSGS